MATLDHDGNARQEMRSREVHRLPVDDIGGW